MRVAIHAVGRLKAGPERELVERYLGRLAKAGPAVGIEFAGLVETVEGRASGVAERRREEGRRVEAALASGSTLILLDERGRNLASHDFASRIGAMRDSGHRNVLFAIGGPDGHDETLRGRAELVISFGAMTWPHQVARVMLAEQLYRAVTILSGHPYHRE